MCFPCDWWGRSREEVWTRQRRGRINGRKWCNHNLAEQKQKVRSPLHEDGSWEKAETVLDTDIGKLALPLIRIIERDPRLNFKRQAKQLHSFCSSSSGSGVAIVLMCLFYWNYDVYNLVVKRPTLLFLVLISVSGGLFSWLDARHSASTAAINSKKAQWKRELGTYRWEFLLSPNEAEPKKYYNK